MGIIFLLIGISIGMAIMFLGLFVYAVTKNQFDDSYTPSVRILFDNQENNDQKVSKEKKQLKKVNHPSYDRKI